MRRPAPSLFITQEINESVERRDVLRDDVGQLHGPKRRVAHPARHLPMHADPISERAARDPRFTAVGLRGNLGKTSTGQRELRAVGHRDNKRLAATWRPCRPVWLASVSATIRAAAESRRVGCASETPVTGSACTIYIAVQADVSDARSAPARNQPFAGARPHWSDDPLSPTSGWMTACRCAARTA